MRQSDGSSPAMNTRDPILPALLAGCCPPAPPGHVCVEVMARTFKVERIVDGDTFKITYDMTASQPAGGPMCGTHRERER